MAGDVDEHREARIFLARDDRKSSRISDTIVAAVIGGAVAVAGMYFTNKTQNEQTKTGEKTALEKIEKEQETTLAAIEAARIEAETQLSFDVRSHILSFSNGVFSGSGYPSGVTALPG